MIGEISKSKVKTIITVIGLEFAAHLTITKNLGAKVYFADSYSFWQKGCIEKANKLIRQYIPKKPTSMKFRTDGL